GVPDLVVAKDQAPTVAVLTNGTPPGGPTFVLGGGMNLSVPVAQNSVTVTDINGDGRPDVVAVLQSAAMSVSMNITVPGALPTFAPGTSVDPVLGQAIMAVAADMDADGRLDLVVADSAGNGAVILLNQTVAGAADPSFYPENGYRLATG